MGGRPRVAGRRQHKRPLMRFESRLVGLRGLESLMPEEAYQNPGFKWGYGAEEEEGAVIGARGADR